MNTIECARNKIASPLIRKISRLECQDINTLSKNISCGKTVILKNKIHNLKKPCAIGRGLRTKVNVNMGASTEVSSIKTELKKLKISIDYGADTVMDLSVGKNVRKIRQEIIAHSTIPVGTVPIYEAAQELEHKRKNLFKMTKDDILEVLERQAEEGVDFFTVHAGITKEIIKKIPYKKRIIEIVSRGGAILANWIIHNNKENPLYEYFDNVLKIAKRFDITLSLGDGLRPGSVLDATDEIQLYELRKLGQLSKYALERGVQTIIEGPGHVPLNQIEKNIKMQKQICHGAPFYVLGPLVTDVSSGYDHISASIGGALASYYGADFLCYVTPSEHLRLPSIDDVREGLIASKIAAHAADIAKGIPYQIDWDRKISQARKSRDWTKQIKLSIDPVKAKRYRSQSKLQESSVCTMCGKYCSLKLIEKCF
ncbi:MAG: phosphomethylpyrimidine synthase ThiC [Candidatus Omnitrophica bacterium]|nr:phosphomethylpyrimidine synthase ThiC [Candidatus Omnitrophota bacterium]MDD5549890.1 phosphomethylpyrimidine synthase ThiC [Candidatus Omnitrophota bacterium]